MRSLVLGGALLGVGLLASSAFGQLAPPPPIRAPLTITPTITITEEFNDNIDLDNENKNWDLITGLTPGVIVLLQPPPLPVDTRSVAMRFVSVLRENVSVSVRKRSGRTR